MSVYKTGFFIIIVSIYTYSLGEVTGCGSNKTQYWSCKIYMSHFSHRKTCLNYTHVCSVKNALVLAISLKPRQNKIFPINLETYAGLSKLPYDTHTHTWSHMGGYCTCMLKMHESPCKWSLYSYLLGYLKTHTRICRPAAVICVIIQYIYTYNYPKAIICCYTHKMHYICNTHTHSQRCMQRVIFLFKNFCYVVFVK